MLLKEAKNILYENGYNLIETSIKGEFIKGEKGGEPYLKLSNDYTYDEARKYFLEAIYKRTINTTEEIDQIWTEYLRNTRIKQFEKTYEQFEKYRARCTY